MQELQPYFPEPIISEQIKLKTKPVSKNLETSKFRKYKQENRTPPKPVTKILMAAILFFGIGLFIIFFHKIKVLTRIKT